MTEEAVEMDIESANVAGETPIVPSAGLDGCYCNTARLVRYLCIMDLHSLLFCISHIT